jgi:hypothetical protein
VLSASLARREGKPSKNNTDKHLYSNPTVLWKDIVHDRQFNSRQVNNNDVLIADVHKLISTVRETLISFQPKFNTRSAESTSQDCI